MIDESIDSSTLALLNRWNEGLSRGKPGMELTLDTLRLVFLQLDRRDMRAFAVLCRTVKRLVALLFQDRQFWFALSLRSYHHRGPNRQTSIPPILYDSSVCWRTVAESLPYVLSNELTSCKSIPSRELELSLLIVLSSRPKSNQDAILQLACEKSCAKVIGLLRRRLSLEHLIDASERGNEDVVTYIHSCCHVPKKMGELYLHQACVGGQLPALRAFRNILNIDIGDSPHYLRAAIIEGHLEAVRILLTYSSIDPRENASRALGLACSRGEVEIVRLLLEDGRSNIQASNGIQEAWSNSHYDVVRLLLSDSRVSEEMRREYNPDNLVRRYWKHSACVLAVGLTAGVAWKMTR